MHHEAADSCRPSRTRGELGASLRVMDLAEGSVGGGTEATAELAGLSAEERERVAEVLRGEYGVLMAALGAAWSASLSRTSLYLGVLSAAGIALGFAAQSGVGSSDFRTFALVVLPLVLFLGVATFARLVQVQRESVVYVTGMNRIRRFFLELVPAIRPFLVLPVHDDQTAIYRGMGAGMSLRPPRMPLVYLIVQTQGIVGVVTAVVAASLAGLAGSSAGAATGWVAAIVAFVVTLTALLAYWRSALAELFAAITPRYPTPDAEREAPF